MKTAREVICDVTAQHNIGAWPVEYERLKKLLDDLVAAVEADRRAIYLETPGADALELLRDYNPEREPWSLIEWESRVRAFLAKHPTGSTGK